MKRMSVEEYSLFMEECNRKAKKGGKHNDEEHRIQYECVEWFRWKYPKHHRNLFAVPNGGSRDIRTAARLKAEGVIRGVADLILLRQGNLGAYLCIEMKTRTGSQSKEQKEFQRAIEEEGCGTYVVVRSLHEFAEIVQKHLG